MAELANLQIVVGADTSQAERGLDALGTKVGGVGSAIQSALGAAAVGAVVGIGAAFVGSVKSAADFEKGISAISAVSGATKADLEGIRQTALQLGKDTSYSAAEAAAGMEEMVKAGVSLEAVMGGAGRAALDLAAAGGTAVPEAAAIMSNAMNVFSADMLTAAQTADIITGAANASAISVHDFGFSLSAVGTIAAQVGLSMQDTAVAIALLGQNGLKGSDAGTSLKAMLNNLVPSTDKASAEMGKLGLQSFNAEKAMDLLRKNGFEPVSEQLESLPMQIMKNILGVKDWAHATDKQKKAYMDLAKESGVLQNAFFDEQGVVKGTAEIAAVLQGAYKDLTKEQQILSLQMLFGTDGQRAASLLMKEGRAGVEEMTVAMAKQGDARRIADERLNNLSGSIEKLKGSLETGAIILGSLFLPALKGMADMMTEQVNAGIDVLEQIPDVIGTIAAVLAGDWAPDSSIHPFTNAVGEAVTVLRDQFGPVVSAVSAFVTGTLVPAIEAIAAPLGVGVAAFLGVVGVSGLVTAAVGGIVAVLGFLLTPLGAIALAAGLLAVAWTTNFIGIRDIVTKVLGGDLAGAFALFVTNVTAVGTQIGTALLSWGQQFVAWVAPMIPPMLAALGTLVLDTVSWIVVQAGQFVAALLTWATAFIEWITPMVPQLLTELGLLLLGVVGWIATVALPAIVTQLVAWATAFWGWVLPVIPPLLAALAGLALAIGGWIKDTALPAIGTQLLVWGTAFVAWVAAAIPPLLTALGSFQTTLTDWITKTAMPVIVTTLAGWVAAFWGWVTTAGPPLLIALAVFLGALTGWIVKTALPALVTQVGLWATAFWGWVGTATPSLMTALGSFLTTLTNWITKTALPDIVVAVGGWTTAFTTWAAGIWPAIQKDIEAVSTSIVASMAELPAKVGALGKAAIAAFIAGWTSQIPTMPSLPSIPSFGGDGGATPQSYSPGNGGGGAGGPSSEEEIDAYIAQVFSARGHDPRTAIAVSRAERASIAQMMSGDSGSSFGPFQLHMGGLAPGGNSGSGLGDTFRTQTGLDPRDISTWRQQVDFVAANLGQTGWKPYHAAKKVGIGDRQGIGTGVIPKIPLGGVGGGAPGSDPSQWPGFMQQVDEQLPDWLLNLATVRQSGAGTFGAVETAAAVSGAALVSHTTDDLGNVTQVYRDAGGNLGATITSAAGVITSTWGAMSTGVTAQSAAMSTGTGQQYDLMATKVVGSVTGMSDSLQTTLMDSSGNTVTTIVGMSGQVTAQYATLANGVSLSMGAMGTTSTETVNAMNGEITTAVTDMAGNMVTTVTTANGTLVGQYVTTGAAVVAAVTTSNEAVVANATETGSHLLSTTTDALGLTTQKYMEANGAIVTIVTDQNRNVLADFTTSAAAVGTVTDGLGTKLVGSSTDAMGNIVRIYAESNGEMVTVVTDSTGKILSDYTTTNDAVLENVRQTGMELVTSVTNSMGGVTETYRKTTGETVTVVTDSSGKIVAQFTKVGEGARTATKPVGEFYAAAAQELDLDFSGAIKEFEKLAKAAKKAAEAVDEVGGKGGKKGGDDDDDPFGRDSGERGDFGENAANGGSVPNYALMAPTMGGGATDTLILKVDIGGRIAEEIYVTGRQLAIQRGRT